MKSIQYVSLDEQDRKANKGVGDSALVQYIPSYLPRNKVKVKIPCSCCTPLDLKISCRAR